MHSTRYVSQARSHWRHFPQHACNDLYGSTHPRARLPLGPVLNALPTPTTNPPRADFRLSTKLTYDRFGMEVPEENSRLQDLDLYFDKNCRENLMTTQDAYEESQVCSNRAKE